MLSPPFRISEEFIRKVVFFLIGLEPLLFYIILESTTDFLEIEWVKR